MSSNQNMQSTAQKLGRDLQNTHISPRPNHKKERIPYEIKNAREWDPDKKKKYYSSSESDEDDYCDYENDDPLDTSINSHVPERSANATTDDGFQYVVNKRSKSNAHLHENFSVPSQACPRTQGKRQRRLRVNLNFKKDNLAKAAFRKRQPHTDKFILPKDCHEIEPNRQKMYDLFEEMGVRLGSFIRPPQHVKDHELLLWGNVQQIQKTMAELQRWLAPTGRAGKPLLLARKEKGFSKEASSIGNQYKNLQRKMQKEAAIQAYQQVPEEGRIFGFTGSYLWPVDEVPPEDILGSSLEAFDPIRFQHKCHIVFDNKLNAFRVLTDNIESINQTLLRIEGTMKEFVAKSGRPDVLILVESPHPSAIREQVKVMPVSPDDTKATDNRIPMLTGRTLDPEAHATWLEKRKESTFKNNRRLEQSLRTCILNLPHYRGLVRMRIQFGTFALRVFRWPKGEGSIPFDDFSRNMEMSGTKGTMIRDLQFKKDATTIMSAIHKATDLLQPVDSSTVSLQDVAPSFSACFDFDYSESPSLNFVVEMVSSAADPTIYDRAYAVWTRKDRRDNAVPLEAFTARVDGGVCWKLQVSTENSIDMTRINPKMIGFSESIRIKKIPGFRSEVTGQKVFSWEQELPGAMQPTSFQQKTAFKYRLVQHTEWELEIARYDVYGDPSNESVPVATNWGATFHNTNWDFTFTANSTLEIGESSEWPTKLQTFFPSTNGIRTGKGKDPGLTEFLNTVQLVTAFLDSIKKKLPNSRDSASILI